MDQRMHFWDFRKNRQLHFFCVRWVVANFWNLVGLCNWWSEPPITLRKRSMDRRMQFFNLRDWKEGVVTTAIWNTVVVWQSFQPKNGNNSHFHLTWILSVEVIMWALSFFLNLDNYHQMRPVIRPLENQRENLMTRNKKQDGTIRAQWALIVVRGHMTMSQYRDENAHIKNHS